MTPEQQRIAIAEACGWESCFYDSSGTFRGHKDECVWILPDYLSDLNAMHGAEKVLTEFQYDEYIERWLPSPCATAAQRAEAFLRTLKG